MPSKLKEKLALSKERLKMQAKKFKPKLVMTKLREEGRVGARRCVWLVIGLILYLLDWNLLEILFLYIMLVLFLFVALPFVFKYFPYIQKNMVFLPYVRWPGVVDFNDPHGSCDLQNTRNLYVDTDHEVKVGVWHILPSVYDETPSPDYSTLLQEDKKTVVLYLHGNSANRAGAHRVELYKVLRQLDCHVVCCDYRGYADSTPRMPNETGVVQDAKSVYYWLVSQLDGDTDRIIVWGHSLGSGVAGHLVSLLTQEGTGPAGLVLESPFNNIYDEVRNHKMCWVWSKMPWFDWFFTESLEANDISFVTDQRIAVIDCPIMILHAEDDAVVPFKLGRTLYETALQTRGEDCRAIQFETFSAELCYGHKYICRDPGLPDIFRKFVERCSRDDDQTDD